MVAACSRFAQGRKLLIDDASLQNMMSATVDGAAALDRLGELSAVAEHLTVSPLRFTCAGSAAGLSS